MLCVHHRRAGQRRVSAEYRGTGTRTELPRIRSVLTALRDPADPDFTRVRAAVADTHALVTSAPTLEAVPEGVRVRGAFPRGYGVISWAGRTVPVAENADGMVGDLRFRRRGEDLEVTRAGGLDGAALSRVLTLRDAAWRGGHVGAVGERLIEEYDDAAEVLAQLAPVVAEPGTAVTYLSSPEGVTLRITDTARGTEERWQLVTRLNGQDLIEEDPQRPGAYRHAAAVRGEGSTIHRLRDGAAVAEQLTGADIPARREAIDRAAEVLRAVATYGWQEEGRLRLPAGWHGFLGGRAAESAA